MDFVVNCRFERKKGWKLPRLMKRKHSRSAVSSPAVHTVSYRRRWNVNNLLAWLTSHHLLIQRAHVLWFLKNHLTCIHRFLICDLGGVVGKASLRLNCEQLRSVNASSGKTKAQLPRPSPTPPHPCHQWYHWVMKTVGWGREAALGGVLWQMEIQRGHSLLSIIRAYSVYSWPQWLVQHAGWLNFQMQTENCAPICYTHWRNNNNNKINQKAKWKAS